MAMKAVRHYSNTFLMVLFSLLVCAPLAAQSCYTKVEDASMLQPVEAAAQQYLGMVQHGDYAGLRSAAIPAVATSFTSIENAIGAHQKDLAGQAQETGAFILDASSAGGTLQRAEFYCGIFNSPDRVGFIIPNLPPGKYAFVSESVNGSQPVNVNFVLQENGGRWQLAGLTIDPQTVAGHDSKWFLEQARAYHQKGANLTAYLFYWMSWKLAAPSEIEYTANRDQIADEMSKSRPANWPTSDAPMALMGNGKSYRVTTLFPEAVPNQAGGEDLDVIVKYQAMSDLSNTAAAFSDNMAVIKSVVTQYPELRTAFGGVVARAVASNGADYGTMLAMKDVK